MLATFDDHWLPPKEECCIREGEDSIAGIRAAWLCYEGRTFDFRVEFVNKNDIEKTKELLSACVAIGAIAVLPSVGRGPQLVPFEIADE